jgi:hypothetical protein
VCGTEYLLHPQGTLGARLRSGPGQEDKEVGNECRPPGPSKKVRTAMGRPNFTGRWNQLEIEKIGLKSESAASRRVQREQNSPANPIGCEV